MSAEQEFDLAESEMRAADRQMDAATRDYMRSLAEAKQALHEYRVEIEEEREDPKAQAEEQRLEREIRQGVHGPALKALQERIDLNQTSLRDVFSGADEHWSADGLRDLFGPALEAAAAEERGETARDADDPGAPEVGRPQIDDKGTW